MLRVVLIVGVIAVTAFVWVFRFEIAVSPRADQVGVLYVLDRWTGQTSYCVPNTCGANIYK